MNGIEAVTSALSSTKFILEWYLSDLDDADLLVRPAPGANHMAWQLGHLIASERYHITNQLASAPFPALPAGFAENHLATNAASDGPQGFHSKANYLKLFGDVRGATLKALSELTDEDLNRPAVGPVAAFAPNLGAVFLLVSNHTLMHGGQVTVIRRLLGKPVLF
jgi:hypothetical protein